MDLATTYLGLSLRNPLVASASPLSQSAHRVIELVEAGVTTVALCFPDDGTVVTVLANAEHDVDTVAGDLVQAARP